MTDPNEIDYQYLLKHLDIENGEYDINVLRFTLGAFFINKSSISSENRLDHLNILTKKVQNILFDLGYKQAPPKPPPLKDIWF